MEAEKPITKKDACNLLNISYNPARLNRIIEDFKDKQEYAKTRKAQNRGRPLDTSELQQIAEEYLEGEPVTEIAKGLFRPVALIKATVENLGIPTRPANKSQRGHTELLPERCVAQTFSPGEIVWSAKHHCAAIIREEISVDHQAEKAGFIDTNYEKKYGAKCYAIWVMENIDQNKEFWVQGIETGGYNAYALAYDLGKLNHLQEEYGVDLSRI